MTPMTEQEWLAFTDPQEVLLFLRDRLSARKKRLFGVGFCRFLRGLARYRDAVVFEPWAEQVADGLMSLDDARAAVKSEWGQDHFFRGLLEVDQVGVNRILALSGSPVATEEDTRLRFAHDLLRCIAGNPIRPVTLDRAWLTPAVIALAKTIYDQRAFDRLPILADALVEAGATTTPFSATAVVIGRMSAAAGSWICYSEKSDYDAKKHRLWRRAGLRGSGFGGPSIRLRDRAVVAWAAVAGRDDRRRSTLSARTLQLPQ
jgi:hypothetical protein